MRLLRARLFALCYVCSINRQKNWKQNYVCGVAETAGRKEFFNDTEHIFFPFFCDAQEKKSKVKSIEDRIECERLH